jgi:hypothetical protein
MKIDASMYIANMHKKDQKALVFYLCDFWLQVTKKNGGYYPPTKFPFIIDSYFSKFLMYLSFLIIFSFYCNIATLFCALGQVIRSQEALNAILTWKSRPRFKIRISNVYHVNCVANVAMNHFGFANLGCDVSK